MLVDYAVRSGLVRYCRVDYVGDRLAAGGILHQAHCEILVPGFAFNRALPVGGGVHSALQRFSAIRRALVAGDS
jgi:hypothetical protein